MLIINTAEDITKDFFQNNKEVHYPDEALYYFSGRRFWGQVWKELEDQFRFCIQKVINMVVIITGGAGFIGGKFYGSTPNLMDMV